MKKALGASLIILTGLLSSCALGFGQIIENPAKPIAKNAGRIVTLKEELRIEDTGAGFFFKNPSSIRVSPRGDIFFKDGQEQALLFDPKGRFVKNENAKPARVRMTFAGGCAYFSDETAEGLIVIRKCRLVGL